MNHLLIKFFSWFGHSIIMTILVIGIFLLGIYAAFLTYQIAFYVPNVRVPSILGLELDQANQILYRSGLKLKVIDQQIFNEGNQFYIIGQNPTPGSEIKKNRTVEVEINEDGLFNKVPNLIGKTIEEAEVILLECGYQLGNIAYSNHHQLPKGIIIAQTPNTGETIQNSLKVNILVSKGIY